jgi:hypothetical protein
MKANELRIGNYLFVPGIDREVIVSAIFKSHYVCEDSDGIRFNESVRINYQPIPLTEEWLLKFRFHKKDAEWYLHPCFELKIIVFNKGEFNGVMFYTRTIHTDFTPIYCTKHINHVHQLQNLYFALTGEELTYGGNK